MRHVHAFEPGRLPLPYPLSPNLAQSVTSAGLEDAVGLSWDSNVAISTLIEYLASFPFVRLGCIKPWSVNNKLFCPSYTDTPYVFRLMSGSDKGLGGCWLKVQGHRGYDGMMIMPSYCLHQHC